MTDTFITTQARVTFCLADVIRSKGITQRQAAEMTGLSENAISKLVGGGLRQVRLDTLQALCNGLEINLEDLLKLEKIGG